MAIEVEPSIVVNDDCWGHAINLADLVLEWVVGTIVGIVDSDVVNRFVVSLGTD